MSLLERLPPVRGRYVEGAKLADFTWLRVGGPADILYIPADEADLARFLGETPEDIPVSVLGAGSNTLVRDGGVRGVVVRLGPGFGKIRVDGVTVRAGAACLDKAVAKAAADAGVAGLEFFVGVPGTIGGAVRMNAGCYGSETKDRLRSVVALDRSGRRILAEPAELAHAYRHCAAPDDWIFTEAVFEGEPGAPEAIRARMDEITEKREATQPIREKTSGSTFANPDASLSGGLSAWQLVDKVGSRGRRVGGARFSEQHANFLINDGAASAEDIERLVESVREDIARETGVQMRWEVRRIGEKTAGEDA